jgi:hypothetical protein
MSKLDRVLSVLTKAFPGYSVEKLSDSRAVLESPTSVIDVVIDGKFVRIVDRSKVSYLEEHWTITDYSLARTVIPEEPNYPYDDGHDDDYEPPEYIWQIHYMLGDE